MKREKKVFDTIARKPLLEIYEKPTRTRRFSTDVVMVTALFFFLALFAGWGFLGEFRQGLAVGCLTGAIVLLWRLWLYDEVEIEYKEVEYIEPERKEEVVIQKRTDVHVFDIDGTQTIFEQPKPGEFAQWLGLVLRDAADDTIPFKKKVTLSQNTAISRGWSRSMYKRMLSLFEKKGWIYTVRNDVPELSPKGKQVMRAWLSSPLPLRDRT